MPAPLHLILGAERSGKSRHAESLARAFERQDHRIVYIASAWRGDAEMSERIERHRQDRPPSWQTIELPLHPLALADTLRAQAAAGTCVLVDCLTLWVAQMICPPPGHESQDVAVETDALLQAVTAATGPLLLVSNEIGWGVTPMGRETRRVVDALGRLHQRLAIEAQRVTLMVAGLPMTVKPAVGAEALA